MANALLTTAAIRALRSRSIGIGLWTKRPLLIKSSSSAAAERTKMVIHQSSGLLRRVEFLFSSAPSSSRWTAAQTPLNTSGDLTQVSAGVIMFTCS